MDIERKNNSLKSRVLKMMIILSKYKNNTFSTENVQKYINKNAKKTIKKGLFNGMQKNEYDKNIYYVYSNKSKNLLFYIHGGSFVEKPSYFQIKFVKKLANKLNSDLIIPIYKTLPIGTAEITLDQMIKLYKNMIEKYDNIYLVGDSAGGGAILSLAMSISKTDLIRPKAIIALSPWLDLSLTNRRIVDFSDKDIVCSIEGNKYCGKLWASNLDEKDYRVSAKYGDVKMLDNVFVSSSSNEICNPDCIDFVKELKKKKINYQYVEFLKQFHNFELYPIKESNLLIQDIFNFIQEVNHE